ncbi:MAG: radical SAM protein [Calditrichaceae bacterium]
MNAKLRIELYPKFKMNEHGARCNLNCVWCHNDMMPVVNCVYDNPFSQVNVILEQVNILSAYYESHTPVQISSAGEPTLMPTDTLTHLIKGIRRAGFKNIGLTTNGTTGSVRLYDRLVNAGLSEVNISLNTLKPERYLYYSGVSNGKQLFEHVVNSVEYALTCGLRTGVNCIYSGLNFDEIDDIIDFTCVRKGLTWKFFDLLEGGPAGMFKPMSQLIDFLEKQGYRLSEKKNEEYVYYMIPVGLGQLKIKISREANLCANHACALRSKCNEGCRASIRISGEGIQPCGVRRDNFIPNKSVFDTKLLVHGLRDGGKLN